MEREKRLQSGNLNLCLISIYSYSRHLDRDANKRSSADFPFGPSFLLVKAPSGTELNEGLTPLILLVGSLVITGYLIRRQPALSAISRTTLSCSLIGGPANQSCTTTTSLAILEKSPMGDMWR